VIASRLLAAVNEPIDGYCNVVHVGASIGISVFRGEGQSAAQLLKVANMAMFEAKKAGKNKFVFSRESSGGEPSECGSCLE
jgi:diguanylate cyclase (GGDEF)-like protein